MAESTIIATLILIPLFVYPYTHTCVDSNKAFLLWIFAVVLFVGWVVGGIIYHRKVGGVFKASLLKTLKFLVPVFLTIFSWLISSAFSTFPKESFWGLPDYGLGFLSFLSCQVFFWFVYVGFQKGVFNLERLLGWLILGSIPVSLVVLLEAFGLGPISPGEFFGGRISGTFCNPIFLSSYLVFILPITLGAFVRHYAGAGSRRFIYCISLFIIGFGQFLALVFSGSRGPMVGAVAGLVAFSIFGGIVWPKFRKMILVGFLVCLLMLSGILVLQRVYKGQEAKGPVARYLHMLDSDYGGSGYVRQLLWETAIDLFLSPSETVDALGNEDGLYKWRWLVGYGPEAVTYSLFARYPDEVSRYERAILPRKVHNQTLEVLISRGLLGLVGYFWLLYLAFTSGLYNLVDIKNSKLSWLSCVIGGVVGTLLLAARKGFAYVGVGAAFGFVAGFLIWAVFAGIKTGKNREEMGESAWLHIGILCSLISHVIESQFSFPTVTSELYLWTFLGILLGVRAKLMH